MNTKIEVFFIPRIIFCSKNGKKYSDSETYNYLKRVRNLFKRSIREAQYNICSNFCQKLPTRKEQWKTNKQKLSLSEKISKVDEIRLESSEISRDPKKIVNCLRGSFANLEVFKCSYIACNYTDKINIPNFTFRAVTRKELYSVIESPNKNLLKHQFVL